MVKIVTLKSQTIFQIYLTINLSLCLHKIQQDNKKSLKLCIFIKTIEGFCIAGCVLYQH